MAIKKELWSKYIVGNLFKGAEFLNYCKRADEYVKEGFLVHIPQAGAKPTIVRNRNTFPATAVRRTDTDIVYLLTEYSSDPTHIQNAEFYEESPEKMGSILDEHIQSIREAIGNDAIFNWLSAFPASGAGSPSSAIVAATVVRTTDTVTLPAHLPGATGTRRRIRKEDLKQAMTIMNAQDIPKEDRYALFSSEMLSQLMDDPDLRQRDMGMELDMKNGVIARLYGFNILERSTTATYDNAATPTVKPVGAATATTDNDCVVCFQKNAVEWALGEVVLFERKDDPLYYGDVYSVLVRAGGRKRYRNAQGIVAIVQQP